MSDPDRPGSLSIVGTGIRQGVHLSLEARSRMEAADDVLYLLAEIEPTEWIHRLNPAAESLRPLYQPDRDHREVYEAIVEAAMERVRQGRCVCLVTYGHPGVFDDASHEALRRALAEGFRAEMLPAISALDCLFVDLGFDPGGIGLQLYDATDFLVSERRPDTSVPLVLWQISVIGRTRTTGTVHIEGLRNLASRLTEFYGADHEAIVYEASPFPVGRPSIERSRIGDLPKAHVTGLASLYVRPIEKWER